MAAFLIISIHLNEDAGGVVTHRHWIVFVVVDSDHVPVPADVTTEEPGVEVSLGQSGFRSEDVMATRFQVFVPGDVVADRV